MQPEATETTPALRVEEGGHSFHFTHAQKLEAIGQLAAGIAHEINTPTQYVGDNVRFLQDAFSDLLAITEGLLEIADEAEANELAAEKLKDVREKIQDVDLDFLKVHIPRAISQTLDGIEQISRIVRAMKEFSHPDRTERSIVQLNSAIESTITVARNEWKYVATIEKDLDPNLPMVPCFAGDLNQVLLNILVNASQAIAQANQGTDEMGKIAFTTRLIDDWVQITISDTGSGIPEDARPKVFDPFFTTKPIGEGTGQGLALSYAIVVEKHGGTITFETEVGKGTTFCIRIPIVAPAATAELL
jgi:signal transduction histidine kinase